MDLAVMLAMQNLQTVRLDHHPTARNKAVAALPLAPGALVVSSSALSTALLYSEKKHRCDACHRLASPRVRLRKCTGCASYWYCGTECQTRQWRAHHKKICKHYDRYVTSPEYQALSPHERVDAILLSHLLAEVFPGDYVTSPPSEGPFATFTELMKSPVNLRPPPLCRASTTIPAALEDIMHDIFQRFRNNNFCLHSHLNSYAHGIFPLASRLFNHSCVPNAVAKYIITPHEPVRMEVVALRDIAEGEEITLPYLDPALPFGTRRESLQSNYGFICCCELCSFTEHLQPLPPPPRGSDELEVIETVLRVFSFGSPDRISRLPMRRDCFLEMPMELTPLLHESYLPIISEAFSQTSHGGLYEEALSQGLTLLALYILLYPANYLQIGMHALELAKTAWNAIVTDVSSQRLQPLENDARSYLALATQVLDVFGPEGDEGGPLEEIRILQENLEYM